MNNRGFTLLEVIIFITIFAIFFVTAGYVVTVSVRSMKFNQNKIVATHLAREVLEWVRGEKEEDWTSFKSGPIPRTSPAGLTWCFNTTPITTWSGGACPANDYSLNGIYKREIKLTSNSPLDTVSAQVTVSWREGTRVYSTAINTIYSVLE